MDSAIVLELSRNIIHASSADLERWDYDVLLNSLKYVRTLECM